MQQLTRRNFVRVCGLAGATYLVSTKWETVEAFLLNPSQDSSPFEIIRGNFDSPNFSGDNPGNAHKKFWDIEAYIASKGGRPTQAREENLVIIGGGMAGLLSAYYTKDLKPLVLDQADRFGGNSKGEKFGNNTYSIGAAYIGFPAAGGDVDALLTDIGIRDQLKTDESEAYYVHMRGQGFKKFWEGQTDPEHAEKFEEAFKLLEKVYKESYPNIPFDPNGGLTRPQLEAMDAMTAEQWLQEQLGDLHLHLMEYFQLYAWTSFGGALNELSAAQFLNFVAAETGGIGIFEGGNATIIEALCKHLTKINGTDSIRTRSAVLEVKNVEDHVEIIFENSSGALELIRAKAAIMAAPKFVAKALLPDLDTEKKDAWSQIKYRAYVVANVLLTKKQNLEKFDVLFMNGEAPDIKRPFVDAVHTGWVNEFKGD
ncbi:MAG: FAD-dependent oxidoreductase [Pseudobdellovibrionaceae bacterium]